jgi:eukaryotic-like serine/threonine-protein kinase
VTDAARLLQLVPTQVEAPDPLIGQIIDGRYRIEALLGRGGMGLVYRARHETLGKTLALKVLKPEVSRDADVIERFRREAQAASAIGSPHICDVIDFGVLGDGSTYFVMEYLDGPSLTSAMRSERPMSAARVVAIARQLCDALGAAHARGIVHRDLKPDNVHLVPRGGVDFVKVLDFGIAKVAGGADKKLTQAGQIFGTPHYMSPEQCSGREVDHRTDIYALGVMLYEMVCGQVPFDADTLMGVLTKHVFELPTPPHEIAAGAAVPSGLEAVVLKCLSKRADDRYPTMAALRADLDQIDRGKTPEAVHAQLERAMNPSRTRDPLPAPRPKVAEEKPRGRGKWIALAVLLLVAIGGAAFGIAFLYPGPRPVDRTDPIAHDPLDVDPDPIDIDPDPVDVDPDPRPDPQPDAVTPPIRLSVDPADALVFDVSGALLGNAPLELERPQGEETVRYRIERAGYRTQDIVLNARTQAELTVHLTRSGRRPQPDPTPDPTPDPVPDPQPDIDEIDVPRDDDLLDPFEDPRYRRMRRVP